MLQTFGNSRFWMVCIYTVYIYIQIYVCVSSLRGGYFGATGV